MSKLIFLASRPVSKPMTTTTMSTKYPSSTFKPTMTSTSETSVESVDCEPGKYYPDHSNCNAYYR